MSTREKRAKKLDKEVQDYTYNLELHLRSKMSTLETILRVSMPHQLTNMRTILWINLLLVGFSFHMISQYGTNLWIFLFWIASSIAAILIVLAMLQRRVKYYGDLEDLDFMADKIDYRSPYARAEALSVLLNMVDGAIKENVNIMGYLAKWMHSALWASLIALVFFISYSGSAIYHKEFDLAKEKPKPSSVKPITPPQRPIGESGERGFDPKADTPTKPKK